MPGHHQLRHSRGKKTHIELAAQEIEVGRDTETERKICGSKKVTQMLLLSELQKDTLMTHVQRIRSEESS
jgi:hypothetical protein